MRNADRAILFATMLLVAASGCDQLSGRNQNRQGGRWYRDGKFPDALAQYEQALKKVDDPIVHFNTGIAYHGVFKAGYDKPVLLAFQSEDVCKNIPNTKPVEASICVKEGDRHYNGNECDDKTACPALSTCTKTTFCSMLSVDIANVAAGHLQTWLKVQPSDDVLHAEIAKVEKQIADLNEKLEADAGKPDKKAESAALEDQIKDLGKKIDDLKAKFHVRDMMTQMWLDSDQYAKALEYWTSLLAEKPTDPNLMAVLAGINLKANDWRKSIEWYLKVAAITKDTSAKATAYQFIGNVAWSKLNSHTLSTVDSVELADRGIGALQKAIELQPESTKPIGLEASLFNFRGTANGASWATAIDRASAQDLQHTLHVLNDKAKQKAAPQPTPRRSSPAPADDHVVAPEKKSMVTTTTASSAGMFGNYQQAQIRKLPPWAAPLLGGCFMFVFAILGAMWVKTVWALDQVDLPKTSIDLAIAPSPPPPPPPPPGSSKPHDVQMTPKKKTVKDLVQPNIKVEKQEVQQSTDVGDPNGEVGGEEGGVAGGVVGGVAGPPPPPPPPPPPAPPQNVPPTMLEGSRVAGDKNIAPDDVTKTEINRSGKDRIVGSFKLCLTLDGNISNVTMLKSTGFPAYDAKIQGKMRSEWRYKPYNVNGKPVPVCTAVTFIYSQK